MPENTPEYEIVSPEAGLRSHPQCHWLLRAADGEYINEYTTKELAIQAVETDNANAGDPERVIPFKDFFEGPYQICDTRDSPPVAVPG